MNLQGVGIAVFCGSSPGRDPRYAAEAHALGRAIGQAGATLVYGGGSVGLMGTLADAALSVGGRVVGVIPQLLARPEVAHAGLAELIIVGTMHERKMLMSQRSAAYIALPGGFGTYDELIEVVTWRQLGLHDKPIIVINQNGFFDALIRQREHAIAEGFIRPEYRALWTETPDVAGALSLLRAAPQSTTASHESLT